MIQIIIEALASTLAEALAGKAVEQAGAKHRKLFGWIGLVVLILLIAGLVVLGIYLLGAEVWPIAILMFLIALFILYIMCASIMRNIRSKKKQKESRHTH